MIVVCLVETIFKIIIFVIGLSSPLSKISFSVHQSDVVYGLNLSSMQSFQRPF